LFVNILLYVITQLVVGHMLGIEMIPSWEILLDVVMHCGVSDFDRTAHVSTA